MNDFYFYDMDNNSNNGNNSNPRSKKNIPFTIILIIISLIGTIGLFSNGVIAVSGLSLCIISLIGSIIAFKKKIKYSKLSLIISAVLVVIYIVLFIIAYVSVNSFINDSRANIFRNDAQSYINGAHMQNYDKIKCENSGVKSYKLSLPKTEHNTYISPFNGSYDINKSFILIEAQKVNDRCETKRYIYLTDGNYSLGTSSNPVIESLVRTAKIKRN